MIHYRRKRPNVKKLSRFIEKLMFVVIAACLIFSGSVALGNYLNKLVQKTNDEQEKLPVSLDESEDFSEDEFEEEDNESGDTFTLSGIEAKAVGCNISSFKTISELYSYVHSFRSEYDTLSLNIKDNKGKYIYYSKALSTLASLPEMTEEIETKYDSETDTTIYYPTPTQKIQYLLECSHDAGLKVSAVIDTKYSGGYSITSDSAMTGELTTFGFDEVVFTGVFDNFSFDKDTESICEYLDSISDCNYGGKIGIVLPYSCFVNTANARYIRQIAQCIDFMCVEFGIDDITVSDIDDTISEYYKQIKGSFSAYNMRVFESSSDSAKLKALTNVLETLEITSYQYASVADFTFNSDTEQTMPSPDTTDNKENEDNSAVSNPYATTTVTYDTYDGGTDEWSQNSDGYSYDGNNDWYSDNTVYDDSYHSDGNSWY